jgi:transposase
MGRKLPEDVANRILIHFQASEPIKEVYKATKVSMSCLYKLRLNYDLWGSLYLPPSIKLGRPKALTYEQEQVI